MYFADPIIICKINREIKKLNQVCDSSPINVELDGKFKRATSFEGESSYRMGFRRGAEAISSKDLPSEDFYYDLFYSE
jgi:hypothetical protein